MEVKADKQLQLKQDPETVWETMTDPARMVVSVPGAELTEQLDERNFKGKIGVKIGPVTAKFNGEAAFTQLKHSDYEMTLEGKGSDTGGKGGASMSMNIHLSPGKDGGTLMNSSMTLSITGKLAQFGSRMIVAVNNKMFDQWAKNFMDLLDNQGFDGEDAVQGSLKEVEALDGGSLAWTAVKGIFKGQKKDPAN